MSILTSNRPQFIELYLNNKLSIDLRNRFSLDLIGATCYMYSSHPISKIVAKATMSNIVKLTSSNYYSSEIRNLLTCKFDGYFLHSHSSFEYLIKFSNIVKLNTPLDISYFNKKIAPPSWTYVKD